MARSENWGGVYPAPVTPMKPDQSIDFASLARLYSWLGSRPGIAGMVVNANAGEGTFLREAERIAVVAAARKAVPASVRIVGSVVANATSEGIDQLKALRDGGADAALVFPIRDWLISRQVGSAEAYFERLSAACDLPLFIFQSPQHRGQAAYEMETLKRLVRLPTVVGMKDAIWEVRRYQEEYVTLKEFRPDLTILSANDSHVLATLAIGADGVLLGLAGLMPDLVVQMVEALKRADLAAARESEKRLWPVAQAIYHTPPYALRHTRTKAALKMLGRIDHDMVREPLLPLDAAARETLRTAIAAAGLLEPVEA
jgi:4-hydroxy-tetrahydrodipicolinate synthase